MFPWSEKFETHVELIDTQHKKLVAILDALFAAINNRELTEDKLADLLDQLVDYTAYHFSDEEQLMETSGVSSQHVKIHKMEHHSFLYDIERMRSHFSPDAESVDDIGEKLAHFITAWLTYHILGIDKVLVAQMNEIKKGISPEKAYENHKIAEFDPTTTRILLDSVLQMWKHLNEHCQRIEQQLADLKERNEI
jgi:hemerythrin-like metal-binding protein